MSCGSHIKSLGQSFNTLISFQSGAGLGGTVHTLLLLIGLTQIFSFLH